MASAAPPSTRQKPRAALRLEIRHVLESRVVGVPAKQDLLGIAGPENIQPDGEHDARSREPIRSHMHRVHGQVPALRRVQEGHPHDIPKRQHETQPVRLEVHHAHNPLLCILPLEYVVRLHRRDEYNTVGKEAVSAVLLGYKSRVQQDPSRQPRPHR